MKKPTSNDVAKLAGVSQSTVSFVLNNRADIVISEETRKKVLFAAKKLNYIPNSFAQGLRTNRSRLIGLIVPTITNPYYPSMIQSIEEYAAVKGYNVLLCNTYRKTENEESHLNLLMEKNVDGIIYMFTPYQVEHITRISQQLPVVIIGEKQDDLRIDTVSLDSFKAGELAAKHLADLGHKKIAFVTSPLNSVSLSREKRLRGIISKLKESGLDKNLIIKVEPLENESSESTYEIELGYNLTVGLLKETDATAIIGVNDMVALGAINAIVQSGLKVPEDISVCGFDNIYLSRVLKPRITTVDHFALARSKMAVDMLIDKVSGGSEEICKVEYEPQLLVRESTGIAKR